MSGTISYLDAWSLWFSGSQVPTNLRMGPLTILWWGRIGKLAAFIGAGTVILDLIGPERLRRIGRETGPQPFDHVVTFRLLATPTILLIVTGAFLIAFWDHASSTFPPLLLITLLFVISPVSYMLVLPLVSRILDRSKPGQLLRYAGVLLLLLGFHFDLLAYS